MTLVTKERLEQLHTDVEKRLNSNANIRVYKNGSFQLDEGSRLMSRTLYETKLVLEELIENYKE
jgi:hypothetical protein